MARTGRPRTVVWTQYKCEQCSARFELALWHKRAGKFCSRACWLIAQPGRPKPHLRKPRVEKLCPTCGKDFLARWNWNLNHRGIFCSRQCSWKKPSLARIMTEPEAAWLAALVDGEGSIVRHREKPNVFRLSIANNCVPLLEKVVVVAGVGKVYKKTKPMKANHAQGYWWACYGESARALLRQMIPWLIVKRAKALAVTTISLEQT